MQAVELATPDVVMSHQFSEALERLSCDELEQLCTLYKRMGIGSKVRRVAAAPWKFEEVG